MWNNEIKNQNCYFVKNIIKYSVSNLGEIACFSIFLINIRLYAKKLIIIYILKYFRRSGFYKVLG